MPTEVGKQRAITDALHSSEHDELDLRLCQAAGQDKDREEDVAEHEDSLTTHHVGDDRGGEEAGAAREAVDREGLVLHLRRDGEVVCYNGDRGRDEAGGHAGHGSHEGEVGDDEVGASAGEVGPRGYGGIEAGCLGVSLRLRPFGLE